MADYWSQFAPGEVVNQGGAGDFLDPNKYTRGDLAQIPDPYADFRDPASGGRDATGQPRTTESPQQMLERYQRDYWAPDREQQLARLSALVGSGAGQWPRGAVTGTEQTAGEPLEVWSVKRRQAQTAAAAQYGGGSGAMAAALRGGTLSSLGRPAGGGAGMVIMRTPSGRRIQVPQAEVQNATSRGAQAVE